MQADGTPAIFLASSPPLPKGESICPTGAVGVFTQAMDILALPVTRSIDSESRNSSLMLR